MWDRIIPQVLLRVVYIFILGGVKTYLLPLPAASCWYAYLLQGMIPTNEMIYIRLIVTIVLDTAIVYIRVSIYIYKYEDWKEVNEKMTASSFIYGVYI